MRRTRTVLLTVTIVSLLIGGSATLFARMGTTVAQDTETFQLAPLNPDFLDYLENPPEPSYGYMPSPVNLSHLSEIPMPRMAALTQPPSAFDWRDEGKVTPVKDQNPCGTCWIFGTIAAIESRVWIVDGAEYDFSEQNVACCTDPSWVYLDGNRCNGGGWSWLATDLLTKKGTRLESCDPYNTGTINTDSCDDACTTIKRITGYRWVANSPSQIDEVKNAIYNYGPVSMAYYHTDDPSRWSGNTYYYPGCTEDADHLVTIVGWDDDVEHPEGGGSGVWIIKNSWGTDWGDDGYFYLCYGSGNMQGVASYRYQDYYAGEIIYYWDEAGLVDMGGYGDNSAWMASVFTCEQNGDLTHVDFWTTSNGAQYQLYIYDGSFGSELASQTGTCDELGYYSIPLDTPVSMTADQQFTVAVKMTTPGNIYPLPVELRGSQLEPPIYDWVEPPIQSGACFVKHYGWNPWVDAVGFAGVGVNFCLRARILTNTPPEVENVTASQGAGTGIVDISYDVSDAEQSSVEISFQYWDSGGSWHDCTTTTGEGSTATGTDKIGTWDAKADFDGQYRADCKIRVIADDGWPPNNIGEGDSDEFILDTKAPTGYGCNTPDDEATEVPVDTALTSLSASDDSPPILYKFMLAEDSGFTQGMQESDWQADTSWSPSALAESTEYWWKVKAKDSFENEGEWCAVYKFTTVNTPPMVENVTAIQGVGTGIVNISYDVDDVQQSSVDISFQYWDSSGWHDCTTTIGDGSTPTGPGKTGTWDAKADFDGQYRADCKIRVIADDNQPSNNIGTGDSGEFALDTEAPTGYCCSTPPDEATGIPIDPALTSLTASDDSPPILYKFMLAEDSGFSQGVQESDWQTDTSWAPSMLAECTDYWWKVKAGDSYGNEGGWCTPFTFTTRVPDIRTPIGDIDFGDVVVESSLDSTTTIYNDGCGPLTVNSITRTSGSEDFTCIGPAAPFDIGAGGSQDITVRFAPSSSGAKGATFNVNSNDPDTPDVTFTASGTGINNPPNQPGSPSPENHATCVSINADLIWTGGDPDGHTVTYDVYFGISTSPPLVSDDQVATTYDPGTMSYDTHYYWKVVATDNHGASTEGPVWDFTTEVDSDGDGVPDIEEQGPDGSDEDYDGNEDGTSDSQQDNVASFHTYNGEHYVTIASPNGTTFVNVQAVDNPSPGDAPAEINFPYGFFEFTVSGVGTGDTPVTLYLPGGRSINAYYKYGQTPGDPTPDPPHWYEFRYDGETGAEISGNKITLHFVDGNRGDDDLTKDGTIVEPGGPGYRKPAGPSGGGGGGGGAPPRGPELKVNMIGRVASGSITKDGELEETIDVTSRDGKVRLCLDEGTVVLDTEGNCLEEVTVGRVLEPPAVREKWHVIGIAYDFGPDGATFDPSVGLTIFYDPEELPERVNEEDLVIAYYHTDSEEWRLLEPSAVDTGAHTVTAPVCHCTHYAIIGREEAVFDSANLSISPSLVDHGDSVTITVEVTNSGGMEGTCIVTLLIDGVEEASQEVRLGPGS